MTVYHVTDGVTSTGIPLFSGDYMVRTVVGETTALIVWIRHRQVDCADYREPWQVWSVPLYPDFGANVGGIRLRAPDRHGTGTGSGAGPGWKFCRGADCCLIR